MTLATASTAARANAARNWHNKFVDNIAHMGAVTVTKKTDSNKLACACATCVRFQLVDGNARGWCESAMLNACMSMSDVHVSFSLSYTHASRQFTFAIYDFRFFFLQRQARHPAVKVNICFHISGRCGSVKNGPTVDVMTVA